MKLTEPMIANLFENCPGLHAQRGIVADTPFALVMLPPTHAGLHGVIFGSLARCCRPAPIVKWP